MFVSVNKLMEYAIVCRNNDGESFLFFMEAQKHNIPCQKDVTSVDMT